jgi:7-cyano-7-deazaguanine synthase in queuosine biosynthesis
MMRTPARPFHVRIGAAGWAAPRHLVNGPHAHLSLREDDLWDASLVEPSRHERDLVRVGFAAYAADRLVRRGLPKSFATPVRQIELTVEVGDVDFWRHHAPLVRQALNVLCDDVWELRFVPGRPIHRQLGWWPHTPPTVCQYSGGLDSAAGAAIRASEVVGPMVLVTAVHQTHQRKRVAAQRNAIANRFGRQIGLSSARTTFGPLMREVCARFDHQETTQRCRAFLFMACGGATASALGSRRVEVLENGIGVINLPLMAGMCFGSRSTRGCHPQFLRVMSALSSVVAGRPIEFVLPFADWTKAEMVKCAAGCDVPDVLTTSMSCVHPLRVRGRAKHCGVCPACIGRRQAFLSAGLSLDSGQYLLDPFDAGKPLPREKLDYLAATVMQVIDLVQLAEEDSRPAGVRRHLAGTHLLGQGESPAARLAVLRRYRDEWLRLIHEQHARGQRWAGLLPDSLTAA